MRGGGQRRVALLVAVSAWAFVCCSRPSRARVADASRFPTAHQFTFWEKPLTFTRTYYVDGSSSRSDDRGPGTSRAPIPQHQQSRRSAAARRARSDRSRHLPRVHSPGAWRHLDRRR